MTKIVKLFVLVVTTWILVLTTVSAHAINTPAGYWKTIDDITGKPQSIIRISEAANHSMIGKVIKNLSPELAHYKFCTACQGDKHNQPLVGMVIMWGFKFNDNEWKPGRILDPTTGKTYRCKIKVLGNGNQLLVHGYIGIPLFGRKQIWQRLNEA